MKEMKWRDAHWSIVLDQWRIQDERYTVKEAIIKKQLSNQEKLNLKNIEKVIFNPPATIVIFTDGTKEVVKANAEVFDPQKGFAIAMLNIMAKNSGMSKGELNRFLDKHIKESR